MSTINRFRLEDEFLPSSDPPQQQAWTYDRPIEFSGSAISWSDSSFPEFGTIAL